MSTLQWPQTLSGILSRDYGKSKHHLGLPALDYCDPVSSLRLMANVLIELDASTGCRNPCKSKGVKSKEKEPQ
jgi:hypothetical protein